MNLTRLLKRAARPALGPIILLAAAIASAPVARAQSNYATPYTFNTFAGTPYFPLGADGTGAGAQFLAPGGMCVDSAGNVYVADQGDSTIRKVTPSGVVTTIAGKAGFPGAADGTGSAARFKLPNGIAVDGSGNLYVSDTGNSTIRMITPAGVVTTVAGQAGIGGSFDGTGTGAQFNSPLGIVWDGSGNLYVSDYFNYTIRKVTVPGFVVTTFAGTAPIKGSIDGTGTSARFNLPAGLGIDSGGNLYVADSVNDMIRKITPSGTVTTLAGKALIQGSANATGSSASFYLPIGVAADSSGNVYVADAGNSLIRKITSGGAVTTFAGALSLSGFVDGTGTQAQFNGPNGIAVDSSGNVYVADGGNASIRKISPSAAVTTLAGTSGQGYADGTGAAGRFFYPTSIAIAANGDMYVVDSNNSTIRKVTSAGVVTTLAGQPGNFGSADGTGSAAQFYYPYGVTLDSGGNLYVTDQGNETIRKVTPGGVVTTIAGTPGIPGATNGTGSGASFYYPAGIAIDPSGNLYVTEERNFDIRKITPSGVVTTLAGTAGGIGSNDGTGSAAQFNVPAGMVLDGSGNLFVADFSNGTIRKVVASSGAVTTFAGQAGHQGSADGPVASASFDAPSGVALDASGNLYVADERNNEIRKISGGVVTTLAGTAPPQLPPGSPPIPPQDLYANGTGSAALFDQPFGLAVAANGNVFVADAANDAIRMGTLSGAPFIQTQPTDQYAAAGGSVTFSVAASGSSTLSYQWKFNGSAIGGATGSSYTITNAQAANAGPYTVTVTDADGSTTSSTATLYVSSGSSAARLVNISTRAQVGTGGNILIPGFVIGGSGGETLLIRADGPALTAFGVGGALATPSLVVLDHSGATVASNTGWGTNTSPTPAQIANIASQVGAFALTANSADCALVVTLNPGAYTVQVSGVGSTTGVALAEIYEVTYTGTARLVNISTRAQVGTGGNILIPGFVIGGSGTEQLLVRGDGPSLTAFGVGGALAQPSLSVFDHSGTVIASNTGWGTSTTPLPAQIASVAAFVGAFPFTSGSADSAQVVTLNPGAYTMQISGVSAATGVALAEVYEVP